MTTETLTVSDAVRELQTEVHNEGKHKVQNLEPIIKEWKPILQKLCREGAFELFQDDEKIFTFALLCENLKRRRFDLGQIATVIRAYQSALKKEVIPE